MRRLAVIIFAVWYTVLIFGVTVDRTYAWASRARETCPRGPCHPVALNRPQELTPHQSQTRISEHQFAAESPLALSQIEYESHPHLYESMPPGSAAQDGRYISPRSPPQV